MPKDPIQLLAKTARSWQVSGQIERDRALFQVHRLFTVEFPVENPGGLHGTIASIRPPRGGGRLFLAPDTRTLYVKQGRRYTPLATVHLEAHPPSEQALDAPPRPVHIRTDLLKRMIRGTSDAPMAKHVFLHPGGAAYHGTPYRIFRAQGAHNLPLHGVAALPVEALELVLPHAEGGTWGYLEARDGKGPGKLVLELEGGVRLWVPLREETPPAYERFFQDHGTPIPPNALGLKTYWEEARKFGADHAVSHPNRYVELWRGNEFLGYHTRIPRYHAHLGRRSGISIKLLLEVLEFVGDAPTLERVGEKALRLSDPSKRRQAALSLWEVSPRTAKPLP